MDPNQQKPTQKNKQSTNQSNILTNTKISKSSRVRQQILVKGSGTSGCLLTNKPDDQLQFVQLKCKWGSVNITDVCLSGLFALGVCAPQQCVNKQKEQEQVAKQSTTTSGDTQRSQCILKWGNFNEQLIMNPEIVLQQIPIKIKYQVQSINCGWNHGLIKVRTSQNKGMLLGIGQNSYGQLNGFNKNSHKFYHQLVQVVGPTFGEVVAFNAGFRQSYWVNQNNQLFGCGQSKNYQLGVQSKKQTFPPNKISTSGINQQIIKITSGKKFVAILTSGGEVFAMGANEFQCITADAGQKFVEKMIKIGENITDVQCGWTHIIMLNKKGQINSQGRNNFGQLGRIQNQNNDPSAEQQQNQKQNIKQPSTKVTLDQTCISIKAGTEFNFAIGKSGKLYGWGWNQHMNIINSNEQVVLKPTVIDLPASFNIKQCITYPAITIVKGVTGNEVC